MAGLLSPPRRASGSAIAANIVVGALARVAIAAAIGLGVDESYAVAVARPAMLGYYDHPPLVFWITALVERVDGAHADVVLRLPFIVIFAATTWLVYRLTRVLFDERAALYAAALLQIIPVFGVSDGGWILPDGPLLLGFALTGYGLARAIVAPDARARGWWLAAGVGAGIAALSKYHAIFLITGTLLFLATAPGARHWLRRADPYLAGVVALAMSAPVWIWNARHGWASFRFQGTRADVHHGLHVAPLLQNLAGQAGYMLPWIWLPLVWLFARALRGGPRDASRWLLACLAAGPVLLFPLLALGGRPGLPHWPAPGFLFLVPLLGDSLARLAERGHARAVRRYVGASAAIVLVLVAFAASQVRTGGFRRDFPRLFAHGDPSLDAVDWRALRPTIDALSGERAPLVIAADWIDGAKIGAALSGSATVLCFNSDDRQFRYVADQSALAGRDAFVVLRAPVDTSAFARISARFRVVEPVAAAHVAIMRSGREALALSVYHAYGLLPRAPGS